MEKAMRIKGKVKAALFYPIAVLVVAIAIMAILMVWVIPKFKDVFAEMMGTGLPPFTEFVLAISDLLRTNAFGAFTALFAALFTFAMIGRTQFGRYTLDKLSLILPVIGNVVEKVAIARFSRTLGTLINSGVPILQALNIVKDTSGNVVVARAVQDVHDSVKEGETIVAPLEASRVFPPMVISMVDVGEKTGDMPQMLEKVADTYDEEVDRAVESLTSLIEPIMIVFLAVIVGSIVIAMFLPLIAMIEGIE
jgi:type IV pilus assembly protein PilC